MYKRLLGRLLKNVLLLTLVMALLFYGLLSVLPAELPAWYTRIPDLVKTAFWMAPELNMEDWMALCLRCSQAASLLIGFCMLSAGTDVVGDLYHSSAMEFYLARKVTRRSFYMSLWSYGLSLTILLSILFAGCILLYLMLGGIDPMTVWGTCLYLALRTGIVWFLFYTIGLCFGCLCRNRAKAKLLSLVVYLALFALGAVSALFPPVWYLSYGAVYHAAIPERVIFTGVSFAWQELPAPVLLMLCSTVGGFFAFKKRDIQELSDR